MGYAYVANVSLRFIFCGYNLGNISCDSTSRLKLL
jgi:hypothetical protein